MLQLAGLDWMYASIRLCSASFRIICFLRYAPRKSCGALRTGSIIALPDVLARCIEPVDFFLNAAGDGHFVRTDDRPNGPTFGSIGGRGDPLGRPYGWRRIRRHPISANDNDPMDVIRHHDVCAQFHVWEMLRDEAPALSGAEGSATCPIGDNCIVSPHGGSPWAMFPNKHIVPDGEER